MARDEQHEVIAPNSEERDSKTLTLLFDEDQDEPAQTVIVFMALGHQSPADRHAAKTRCGLRGKENSACS
jgi:hypothetical protein